MRGSPFLYDNFTDGLNTIDAPFAIQDSEARDAINVAATPRGSIQKRLGTIAFTPTPPAVELTSIQPIAIAGVRSLIAVGGTKIYRISAAGAATDITGSATVTAGSRWCIVQAPVSTGYPGQGPVYMSNGIDPPLQWTGTGNVTAWNGVSDGNHYGTAPYVPNGAYMIFHENRIWMTGVAGDPSAVWFSDLITAGASGGVGDPSSWPLVNFIRFDSFDGKPITGIGEAGPWILVFKEFKSWVITDPNGQVARQLDDGVGCIAHRSIAGGVDGTYFLTSDRGIYVTSGTKIGEAGYKVRPTILAINQANRANACATVYNNHYYLSFPLGSSTQNNRTLDYDEQLKSWWLHDLVANDFAIFDPVAAPMLYAALPGSGTGIAQWLAAGVYTDLGVPYAGQNGFSAYWLAGWQRFYEYFLRHRLPMPMVKKRVRQVYFTGNGLIVPMIAKNFKAGLPQYPATVNNQDQAYPTLPVNFMQQPPELFGNPDTAQLFGGTTYGGATMIFGGLSPIGDARIYAPGIAEEWSVGFGNATADPFRVDAYSYAISTRKS